MIERTFPLPSRGLLPNSLAELSIREMTVHEEKGLFMSKKPFVKMMDLIRDCSSKGSDRAGNTTSVGDISSWPIVDMSHALFKLRSVSIGRIYDFKVQCSVCDQSISWGVDLEDGLDTKYAPDDIQMTYKAKLSFSEVEFKHLLVKDQLVLDRLIQQRKSKLGNMFDNGYTLRLAAQLAGHDGEDFGSVVAAETWMEQRTTREREEINAAVEANSFGDDLSLTVECPHCGNNEESFMPLTREFLFRRRSRSEGEAY